MIEHGPVLSTDRLEKPKRPPAPDPAPSAADPPVASATLPRRWGGSNRIVVHNKGEFKLRRNGSLADMSRATPPAYQGFTANGANYQRQADNQPPASQGVSASGGSYQRQAGNQSPASQGVSANGANYQRQAENQPPASQGVSANGGHYQRQPESQSPASLGVAASGNHVRQAAVANADTLRVQVPAHVVKSIVVSVLHQQGVPNPSEEILNAAIQEYYAKNPQGVSFPLTCDAKLHSR